ncbi:TSUP family transporter [Litoribacillus peritrichatus]|uniref:Probable membrane transporter protein n=1 Tax=Litoribacillus peritrichatus TaxID=718191 RepID=A0ABP7MST5_9GAMM
MPGERTIIEELITLLTNALEFITASSLITPELWLLLILAAFSAGMIDAIAGGGGLITIPALLMAGLPPHLALGTNKLCASFGSFTATLVFIRQGVFQPKMWYLSSVATLTGAVFGTICATLISIEFLNQVLPVLIISVAIYMLFQNYSSLDQHRPPAPQSHQVKITQGTAIGFYDGIAGPGTGSFWVVSNLLLYRQSLLQASGHARAMNFISNITSFITFALLGQVNWLLGLSMGGFLLIGAWLGAHMAIAKGAKLIKPIFMTVVIAISVKLLVN